MNELKDDNSCALFTVCSICYLSKALVLAESVYKYEGKKLIIYLADKKTYIADYHFCELRWLEDEEIPGFNTLSFIYDVTEFSTSVKPFLALKLLNLHSKVIFLDPDICLYKNLNVIHEKLAQFPIVLTPHYITPKSNDTDQYDLAMMRFGSFNLGFFAVSSDPEGKRFLEWWSERCIKLCYFETQFGLSTDQKWVSIAPCFFPTMHISFNLGLNMAFWNLHERTLEKTNGSYRVNGADDLVFFHFSSFNSDNPSSISSRDHLWQKEGRADLTEICTGYANELAKYDHIYKKTKYGFDYMNNGLYISPTARRAYAAVMNDFPVDNNPFEYSGKMKQFIKKNYLVEKSNSAYKTAGLKDKSANSGKFNVIYMFLRMVLKIIGPNKFYNLSRLFVYLSSYRQNRDLWKL